LTSTLTGGTYNAYSGAILLSQANATAPTPAVITTNAATILLDGATAKIADGSRHDILQGFFTTNATAGNFTIQNGANLTSSSSDFNNAGTMNIGANSTFTVGGSHNYVQSAGLTYLQASTSNLVAAMTTLNGGTLQGFGTGTGNLSNMGGTVHPGDGPGTLTVTGNYSQSAGGTLDTLIGGSSQGATYSWLNVSGTATLAGTLDLSLVNGFAPTNGQLFVILTSGGLSGQFNDNSIQIGNVTFNVEYSPGNFPNDVVLDASVCRSFPFPSPLRGWCSDSD